MTPDALAAIHLSAMTTSRAWSAKEFAGLIESDHVFLVSETDGFALGRAIAGEAELLTIAVTPAAQRHGIGRTLLGDFETQAHDRAAQAAFLEVAADNAPALALYRSQGWHKAGRRRDYYVRPDATSQDAILMSKQLP